MGSRHAQGAERAAARLGTASWVFLAVALGGMFLAPDVADPNGARSIPVIAIGSVLLFGTNVARAVALALARPARRTPLLALGGAILLLFCGFVAVNVAGAPDTVDFPAPGEWFFVGGYALLAGSALLDVDRRRQASLSSWLDAAVICGGAGCVAALLLLTPMSRDLGGGVPLLVGLLYPLIDVTLGALTVGQVALRRRPADRYAALIVLGWGLVAAADLSLIPSLTNGTYDYTVLANASWAAGLQCVVTGTMRLRSDRRRDVEGDVVDAPRGATSLALLVPQVLAVGVLVIQPSGTARWYVVAPALATLAAAGLRTLLALRAAREADEATRLSLTDDLTRLPNRRAFIQHVDRRLGAEQRIALILLDLDGFKEVNDSLGHAAGDVLLRVIAKRLADELPPRTHLSRLGGDEFAVVVPQVTPDLADLARHIGDVVHRPVSVDDLEVRVSAAVGVSVSDADDHTHDDLLRRADVAMYQSKTARNGVVLYDPARDDSSRWRLGLAQDLRRGLTRGELTVHYQPQVSATTGAVTGVEALARWRHPREGLVSPGVFLPVARRAGLMTLLSEVVVENVVADLSQWEREHGLRLNAAINVAPPELLAGPVLARLFARLEETGVAPERIVVEVTEETFLSDPERAREVLMEIRGRGLQMSIDDYGTGFSSLAYLRDLPVQELKVDRSFVAGVTTDERSRLIVGATVQLARGLGMRTVGEGVEDVATADALAALGVDVLQGFHLARPMPAADVADWVAGWSARDGLPTGAVPHP